MIAIKLFEYALTTAEIGVMFSKGLDPHGLNILYAYGDANLRIPRPQGCRIVMLNGGAVSFTSKMQTVTAPSTTWAETTTLFDCSTDVLGLRNLLSELGHLQEEATVIYQDNKSAIQIATNRGSLGKTSRAMDLKTLSIRDRIEDHKVFPVYLKTDRMLADMGSKALSASPFIQFRDIMNGYALVKAHYPDYPISDLVYDVSNDLSLFTQESNSDSHHPISRISALILGMKCTYLSHEDDEDLPDEAEEEEEDDDDDDMDTTHENDTSDDEENNNDEEANQQGDTNDNDMNKSSSAIKQSSKYPPSSKYFDNTRYGPSTPSPTHHQPPNVKRQPIMRIRGGAPDNAIEEMDNNQSSDINNEDAVLPMPCYTSKFNNGFCKWGANCRFQHKNKRDKAANITTYRCFDSKEDTKHITYDQYATYNLDLIPQEKLGGYSPYEIRTGRKPNNVATSTTVAPMPSYQRRDDSSDDSDEDTISKIFEEINKGEFDSSKKRKRFDTDRQEFWKERKVWQPGLQPSQSNDVNDGGEYEQFQSSPYVFNLNQFPNMLCENDDLPDPRIYNIDVQQLRYWHIHDLTDATCLEDTTYDSYYRYLEEMNPFRREP
jgi:hypothetical protein